MFVAVITPHESEIVVEVFANCGFTVRVAKILKWSSGGLSAVSGHLCDAWLAI